MMINTEFLFDDIFTLLERAVIMLHKPFSDQDWWDSRPCSENTHTHTMTHTSFKWKERREGKERGEETWRDGAPLTVELKSVIDLSLLVWLPSPWKKVRHIRLKCLLTTFYEARKCNPITVWLMSALRSAAGNDTTLKSSLGKKGKGKRTKANSRSLSNFRKSIYSATAVAEENKMLIIHFLFLANIYFKYGLVCNNAAAPIVCDKAEKRLFRTAIFNTALFLCSSSERQITWHKN